MMVNFILTLSLFLTQGNFIDTWVVGDTANYKVTQGLLKGKVTQQVTSKTDEEAWLKQELKVMGRLEKAETLVGKNGEIKRVIVNGREQRVPNPDEVEVIKTEETEVSVPAGTFKAIYTEILQKRNNKISKAWLNPQAVPTGGLIKGIQPHSNGDIVLELVSYTKN